MALHYKDVRIQGKYLELTETTSGRKNLLNPDTISFIEEHDGYCVLFILDDENFIIDDTYDNIRYILTVQL